MSIEPQDIRTAFGGCIPIGFAPANPPKRIPASEEEYAARWKAMRRNEHRQAEADLAVGRPNSTQSSIARLLRHLDAHDDTISGLMNAMGKSETRVRDWMKECKDAGWIATRRTNTKLVTVYITDAGRAWVQDRIGGEA